MSKEVDCFGSLLYKEFVKCQSEKEFFDLPMIINIILEDSEEMTELEKVKLAKGFMTTIFYYLDGFGITFKEFRGQLKGSKSDFVMVSK